ncbi:MAG: hypothetical protein NXI04_09005 [Planctomycetaceae bacterium]|nr:hypothetical protein [Planctomycetaceae bacterium]
MQTVPANPRVTFGHWGLAATLGGALAAFVWWGLLTGSGLIGGDIYAYFLPQKLVMAEAFASGELPLWHRLTGLGYPLLAESQAGVFYPPNQVLYRVLDVETAFHWGIVGHYAFAFLFTWRFARCQNLSQMSALLTAVIFVYGWFPARISHEWSIVAGVWFPLTLWITDSLLKRPSGWLFAALVLCLGTHLLSGHFTLAFVGQLTICLYAVLFRLFPRKSSSSTAAHPIAWRTAALPLLAVALSLGTAGVQLLPTYELKLASQRHGEHEQFDPAFGHLPPVYLTQLAASWTYWHTPEIIQSAAFRTTPGAVAADTNHVEAHFYWGLIPLGLVLASLSPSLRQRFPPGVWATWSLLSLLAVVYATGWLMPLARHLPGFGFFNGPGRYTMVAALGGGLIAGLTLDALLIRWKPASVVLLVLGIGGLNVWDTLTASRYVADAIVVPLSPLQKLDDSWVRQQMLSGDRLRHRLLAPGPNIGNFFGVSCVPQYLGLGPSVYYSEQLNPSTSAGDEEFPNTAQREALRALGVSHILTTEPIPQPHSAIELQGAWPDAVLNLVWGRGGAQCFLYRLTDCDGLIVTAQRDRPQVRVTELTNRTVAFDISLEKDSAVTLKELMYPGWQVTVDGERQVPLAADELFRTVNVPAGQHTVRWRFEPASLIWGAWCSGGFLLLTIAVSIVLPRKSKTSTSRLETSAS